MGGDLSQGRLPPARLPGRQAADPDHRLRAAGVTAASVILAVLASLAVGAVTGALFVPPPPRFGATGPATAPTASLTPGAPPATAPGRPARTVVAGVATTAAAPRPSPAASAAQARREALALDRILDAGLSGRRDLGRALARLESCRGTGSTRALARKALANRVLLLERLGSAQVRALPDGERVRALMTTMWAASRDADAHYYAWSLTVGAGTRCSGDQREKAAGDAASRRARAAKQAFLLVWNSRVARPHGLDPRTSREL
jgi:hypothetical protein